MLSWPSKAHPAEKKKALPGWKSLPEISTGGTLAASFGNFQARDGPLQSSFSAHESDSITGFAHTLFGPFSSGSSTYHIDISGFLCSSRKHGDPVREHLGIATHGGHKARGVADAETQLTNSKFSQKRSMMDQDTELTKFPGCDRDIHHLTHDRFFRRYNFEKYFFRHLLTILY
jgi:hypothetical protein